ncbi:methionine--tRNA ligase [Sesbania bispinosa]|nr:methionine--tRNA ligase [Sesbania bispinosa]
MALWLVEGYHHLRHQLHVIDMYAIVILHYEFVYCSLATVDKTLNKVQMGYTNVMATIMDEEGEEEGCSSTSNNDNTQQWVVWVVFGGGGVGEIVGWVFFSQSNNIFSGGLKPS